MSAQDFIEAMTGPRGSDVEFTIGWAADTGTAVETLKLTRAYLDGLKMASAGRLMTSDGESWRPPLLEEVGRTERDTLAEVDALVQQQAAQVRERVDAERHRLRQALVERARVVARRRLRRGRARARDWRSGGGSARSPRATRCGRWR